MDDYKTKHMPVDDAPYIAYSGEMDKQVIAIFADVADPIPNASSVEQGSSDTILFAKVFVLGDLPNNDAGNIGVSWVVRTVLGGTLSDDTFIKPLSRTGYGTNKETANYVQRGELHVGADQATSKKLVIWAEAPNGVKSNVITLIVTEPQNP